MKKVWQTTRLFNWKIVIYPPELISLLSMKRINQRMTTIVDNKGFLHRTLCTHTTAYTFWIWPIWIVLQFKQIQSLSNKWIELKYFHRFNFFQISCFVDKLNYNPCGVVAYCLQLNLVYNDLLIWTLIPIY